MKNQKRQSQPIIHWHAFHGNNIELYERMQTAMNESDNLDDIWYKRRISTTKGLRSYREQIGFKEDAIRSSFGSLGISSKLPDSDAPVRSIHFQVNNHLGRHLFDNLIHGLPPQTIDINVRYSTLKSDLMTLDRLVIKGIEVALSDSNGVDNIYKLLANAKTLGLTPDSYSSVIEQRVINIDDHINLMSDYPSETKPNSMVDSIFRPTVQNHFGYPLTINDIAKFDQSPASFWLTGTESLLDRYINFLCENNARMATVTATTNGLSELAERPNTVSFNLRHHIDFVNVYSELLKIDQNLGDDAFQLVANYYYVLVIKTEENRKVRQAINTAIAQVAKSQTPNTKAFIETLLNSECERTVEAGKEIQKYFVGQFETRLTPLHEIARNGSNLFVWSTNDRILEANVLCALYSLTLGQFEMIELSKVQFKPKLRLCLLTLETTRSETANALFRPFLKICRKQYIAPFVKCDPATLHCVSIYDSPLISKEMEDNLYLYRRIDNFRNANQIAIYDRYPEIKFLANT
ncbi:hypothetical protein [Vibrio barjaei]|uniref:hypothetical protein n=1 Tax=Vibrio barjaei TaxID=1676683 RepID=UPI0022844526|nr:hypothetical protein [Vibrio barjaei]MCY9870337.1 hypothetical protein [Vibrio barjaei]